MARKAMKAAAEAMKAKKAMKVKAASKAPMKVWTAEAAQAKQFWHNDRTIRCVAAFRENRKFMEEFWRQEALFRLANVGESPKKAMKAMKPDYLPPTCPQILIPAGQVQA